MAETIDTIKFVFRKKKYLFLSLASAIVVFVALYYFMLATVAKNSLWIAVSMSGAGYITETLASIFLISSLTGIYLSLIIFRFSLYAGKSFFGFIGSGISAFGVGCPTCGAFLFGLVGVPFTLMYLPFKGTELRLLGVFVLALSVYLTAKSIRGKCDIKRRV